MFSVSRYCNIVPDKLYENYRKLLVLKKLFLSKSLQNLHFYLFVPIGTIQSPLHSGPSSRPGLSFDQRCAVERRPDHVGVVRVR